MIAGKRQHHTGGLVEAMILTQPQPGRIGKAIEITITGRAAAPRIAREASCPAYDITRSPVRMESQGARGHQKRPPPAAYPAPAASRSTPPGSPLRTARIREQAGQACSSPDEGVARLPIVLLSGLKHGPLRGCVVSSNDWVEATRKSSKSPLRARLRAAGSGAICPSPQAGEQVTSEPRRVPKITKRSCETDQTPNKKTNPVILAQRSS